MSPACSSLPSELLLMIFSYLPIPDIKHLRLVSQHYHNCASQSLIPTLGIASDMNSLQFWSKISSADLFRRGVSKIVYNTRLTPEKKLEMQHIITSGQVLPRNITAIEQYYNIYYHLRTGIPRLPMLRDVTITDELLPLSSIDTELSSWNATRWRRQMVTSHNGKLGLFILLRALSAACLAPESFHLSLQNCISGSTARTPDPATPNNVTTSPPRQLDHHLETAMTVFRNVRELSIETRGPDLDGDPKCSAAFIRNLSAFVLTAGWRLDSLQVVVQDMPLSLGLLDTTLFSTTLFNNSPVRFPTLRYLELTGVDIGGFELIAFLSQQSCLEKLLLQYVYLTRDSPEWTGVIEDLCWVLGAQFEDGEGGRCRTDVVMPMERMQLDLEHVFEPFDELLEVPLTVRAGDLRAYFGGREGNPLRACYESFVVTAEGS